MKPKKIKVDAPIKEWTDKQLKDEAYGLHDIVYVVDCYSTRDILRLNAVIDELRKRNYDVYEVSKLMIKIDDGDDDDTDD